MRLAHPLTVRVILSSVLAAVGGPAMADTIHLADGRVLEGTVEWHADGSAIDIHITSTGIDAILTVPRAKVVRIEPGPGPHQQALAEVESRRAALHADSSPVEYIALAQKARAIGDDTLARDIIHELLAVDPTNAQAHVFLGEMLINGVWMTVPEAMAAKGCVLYEGQWMPEAEATRLQEQEAQRRRAQEDAARHAREQREYEESLPAPGYSAYDNAMDDGASYDMGGYALGGWPWWFGGPAVIGHHRHHHGFAPGFVGGFGFGHGGFGGVHAGGFGVVIGGRR